MPQSSEWTRRGEFIRLINEAATSPTKASRACWRLAMRAAACILAVRAAA